MKLLDRLRKRPALSVILCTYNMGREAPRTIASAAVPYQRGVEPDDYEVIVVDNGSTDSDRGIDPSRLPPGVRWVAMPDPQPSPVFAMNWAVREQARGHHVLLALDGARIFSDGLVAAALAAHRRVDNALAYTLSFHLGPKQQMESTQEGYNQEVEDVAIAASGWPEQPDALFAISVFAGSSSEGYFHPVPESNAFSVSRRLFDRLGGYDERYTSPGGGMANLELFGRYATHPDVVPVCLLAEGTFHQVHGGVATSGVKSHGDFIGEHVVIFGSPFELPEYAATYFGTPRPEADRFVAASLATAGLTEPPPSLTDRSR